MHAFVSMETAVSGLRRTSSSCRFTRSSASIFPTNSRYSAFFAISFASGFGLGQRDRMSMLP
jgi:hypothetical protein